VAGNQAKEDVGKFSYSYYDHLRRESMHGILVYGKHGGHNHSKESFLYPTSSNTSKMKVIGKRECSDNKNEEMHTTNWRGRTTKSHIRPQFPSLSIIIIYSLTSPHFNSYYPSPQKSVPPT